MTLPTSRSYDMVPATPSGWRARFALIIIVVVAAATIWITNSFLTDRFTENTRNRAELRLALYSGNLLSELRRNAIVPQLLAKDPELIGALESQDFSSSTARLISFVDEIGAASLLLLDESGRTVAATDRTRLGTLYRDQQFFINALRSNATLFTTAREETGAYRFIYSRRLESQGKPLV